MKQDKNFSTQNLSIEGLRLIKRKKIEDERGYLSKIFSEEDLISSGWKGKIVQINHTLTLKKGTIRGFHYQNFPYKEIKLVSCVKGKIIDIAVDLRKESPTFLQWHAETLSESNLSTLLIPEGFAHGFQTLEESCELIYLHSENYHPSHEGGVKYNDPKLDITWPLDPVGISERDLSFPLLSDNFKGIE